MAELARPTDSAVPSPGRLHALLLAWWDAGRRDLPWRQNRDPYRVLLSEVMLQQTQAARVGPKFVAFVERFPTLRHLADAATADVIRAWSGLGYNRRAVNLQRLARVVMAEHGGAFPTTVEGLLVLPGIGPYTARAVASIAFGAAAAPVDTNIRRVLTRVVDGPDGERAASATQRLADSLLPSERPGDWNEALMELGALVCVPVPRCEVCPLAAACATAGQAGQIRERRAAYRTSTPVPAERFEHSTRFYRGRIVQMLGVEDGGAGLTVDQVGARLRLDYTPTDRPWLESLLVGLDCDGLIAFDSERASLPAT